MGPRFTVLSDTPIAAAIAGCAIPLSRNNPIWMRRRCAAGIFHRSAVFSRRTSALLHLTICSPESDGSSESHLNAEKQPVQAVSLPYPNRPDSRRYGAGIRRFPIRIDQFDQTRNRLAHRFDIARFEVRSEREVTVENFGECVLSKLSECLR